MLNSILWVLHTGAQWRELPGRYGPWKAVYDRFRRWTDEGLFDRILQQLQLWLDDEGRIDSDLWLVDGSSVRASRSSAGGKGGEPQHDRCLGRSRGGFGTKIHLLACGGGVPLAVNLTPGCVAASLAYTTAASTSPRAA